LTPAQGGIFNRNPEGFRTPAFAGMTALTVIATVCAKLADQDHLDGTS
jgi:hypothetical protein